MSGREITGRKVLAMLLGFFALIVAVNGVFIYFALDSFSGLSTQNAYVKGLNYNRTLAQNRAQKATGLQITATASQPGQAVVLDVVVKDRHGKPIENLTLSGQLRRPTHEGEDLPLEFQAMGAGSYRATATPEALGQWDLRLLAQVADADDYRWEKRLWLK
ncbi:MAG: FixH family protein [Rhodospirillaceae bacterium]|jgi:nitrogen fixation protein FixH|nr:FixH family protein [Rhodospirillaceae bacterium]MBT3490955.1 FixH family protein [Rhodospirillaceae bacterium]MBT3780971.1 FixH family protein [Rhodospirillaceae bacterium]MBT3978367.1 FixH family protein [Rhodospirillaceae bacterium]MBT4170550.1 FixH family protein [Rhodospirillaceae bacterium]